VDAILVYGFQNAKCKIFVDARQNQRDGVKADLLYVQTIFILLLFNINDHFFKANTF
jgi:hypothetical protein